MRAAKGTRESAGKKTLDIKPRICVCINVRARAPFNFGSQGRFFLLMHRKKNQRRFFAFILINFTRAQK